MMAKLVINISVSVKHHWLIISRPNMDMKMRIRV